MEVTEERPYKILPKRVTAYKQTKQMECEKARQIKVPAAKPQHLSSVPMVQMVEKETQLLKVIL